MLSLMPNWKQIIHYIQHAESPKLYLLNQHNENKVLSRAQVVEFAKYLPNVISTKAMQPITEFKERIWKTEHFASPLMRRALPDYKHPAIKTQFEAKEILLMIIVFVLDNWEQLWPLMGWPNSFEIQKRLRFLKENDKWVPNPKHIADIFLSIY